MKILNIKTFIVLALLLAFSGCNVVRFGKFKGVAQEVPDSLKEMSTERVVGEVCYYFAFFEWPSVQSAVEAAIAKAPGATALLSAEISVRHSLLWSPYKCVIAKGIPAKPAE